MPLGPSLPEDFLSGPSKGGYGAETPKLMDGISGPRLPRGRGGERPLKKGDHSLELPPQQLGVPRILLMPWALRTFTHQSHLDSFSLRFFIHGSERQS